MPDTAPAKQKEYKLSDKSLKNMGGCNPILIRLAKEAIKLTEVDFGIIQNGGLRTAEEQHQLFIKGVSKADGFARISYHQTANAIDLIPYVSKRFTWENAEAFRAINKAVTEAWKQMNVKGVQLDWGGNWKNFPRPQSLSD